MRLFFISASQTSFFYSFISATIDDTIYIVIAK